MAGWLALLPVLAKERNMERKDADILESGGQWATTYE